MIDTETMDKLIPVPSTEQLMEETKAKLADKGFPVTNFQSGGVFYTLLNIFFQIKTELLLLLRTVLNNIFVSHATGLWLELLGANYSIWRKRAVKARGMVTLTRSAKYPVVKITKGHVFKSDMDASGQELRYIATDTVILQNGQTSCQVPVEAERVGSVFNVPEGIIRNSLTHLESIEQITNTAGWLTREGADQEDFEALRSRIKSAWADLSSIAIRQKYQNTCEAVPGVLLARIDDEHPRGQGTVDAIITSTAGAATPTLLAKVAAALEKIRGPYDDVLVKSSQTVAQDIAVVLQIPGNIDEAGLEQKAIAIITKALSVSKDRNLNELYVSDLIYQLRAGIPLLRNVNVTTPTADVLLEKDKVITLGAVTVTIERL